MTAQSMPSESVEPRSSCEIVTSTRGYDVKVKVYVGSPVGEAVDECITEWLRARAELERRLMGEMAA